MRLFEADSHNFGKRVELVERASEQWFRKPRSVFWEHLFFGRASPLLGFFDKTGENGKEPLSKYLFNLDVEPEHDWLGHSREVLASDEPVVDEHFYSFGVLLAYSFVFGIRDLHKFNLVRTKSHLQAVDAEVVFTDLLLPHESVLLPFKDVSIELSGIRHLTDSLGKIPTNEKRAILSGYFDLFAVLYEKQEQILAALETNAGDAPVRVILRNTGIYKAHLKGGPKIDDLLAEEKEQLNRGDIPYFFKRLGDDRLHWLSASDHNVGVVATVGNFQADVSRHASSPSKLIGNRELTEKKMVHGTFLLQKQLLIREPYNFLWNEKFLRISLEGLVNEATGREFRNSSRSPLPTK
jgi:lantibiotic modifying enzyme